MSGGIIYNFTRQKKCEGYVYGGGEGGGGEIERDLGVERLNCSDRFVCMTQG